MAAAFLAVAQAAAQPAVRPAHDVAVTYAIETAAPGGSAETRTVQMYWTAQGTRLRLQTPGQPGFALIDFGTNRMVLVITGSRRYLELAFDPRMAPGLNIPPGASVTQAGADTVAGAPCTVWDLKGPEASGRACITQDGLVLRVTAAQAGQPALQAVSVAYGPQPADLFVIPSGYQRLTGGHQ